MRSFYLLVFTFFFASYLFAQEWEEIAPMPNGLVTDHSYGFALNGKGYFVAGADENFFLNVFFEYDPTTDSWTELDPFPVGGRGFGIGDTWNGKAYFGFGFDGSNYRGDIWEFDPDTGTWTEITTCPCSARIHPAFIVHNDKIFVGLGGSAAGNLNDWWEYDMLNDTWEQKPDFPALPRHHPFQFAVNDSIYVGFGHGNGFISNEWYRYDPTNDEWEQKATLPGEGRVAGTQSSFEDKGYVLSGDGVDHTSMQEGEFWSYDPVLDEWEELTPHPGWSRWAPASFVLDGWVYLLSGPTNIGGFLNYSPNNNYRYQLEEGMVSSTQNLANASDLFELYPNPFADQIQFNWKKDILNTGEGLIRIFDNFGRSVYQNNQLPATLNLDFLTPGIYHIEVTVNDERAVERMVKE